MKYCLGLNGYWPAPATLAQHLTDIGSVLARNRRQQYALSDQRAIERSHKPHYVSHIAVVPKRNYKFRLIQNLRPVRVVNYSCCKLTFQCENFKTVAQLIEPKDDLATVDIKNGFHHIKIHSLYCPQEPFITLTLKALNYFIKPWRPKVFFQFEIIINVLVSSSRFIWIPMLWVYGHWKYVDS